MGAGHIGLVFCLISFVAIAISVGIPYWSFASLGDLSSFSGLWQFCQHKEGFGTKCLFQSFGLVAKWDAIRGLEAAGCVLGVLGTILAFVAVCSKKSPGMFVGAGVMELLSAALVGTGFIIYAAEFHAGIEYAYAAFYMNIIGAVGLGFGGLVLICARGQVQQSHTTGLVIQSQGFQNTGARSDIPIAMQHKY